jgi:hypothetical protein
MSKPDSGAWINPKRYLTASTAWARRTGECRAMAMAFDVISSSTVESGPTHQ